MNNLVVVGGNYGCVSRGSTINYGIASDNDTRPINPLCGWLYWMHINFLTVLYITFFFFFGVLIDDKAQDIVYGICVPLTEHALKCIYTHCRPTYSGFHCQRENYYIYYRLLYLPNIYIYYMLQWFMLENIFGRALF